MFPALVVLLISDVSAATLRFSWKPTRSDAVQHSMPSFLNRRSEGALEGAAASGRSSQASARSEYRFTMTLRAASEIISEMASDAEMGSDLGVNTAESTASGSGPANLAEYCSPKPKTGLQENQAVEADWRGMGMYYPGEVAETHKDGTVDIAYDDGWTEERVKVKRVHPMEEESAETVEAPKDDPACDLLDFVQNVTDTVQQAHLAISQWLAAGGAKHTKAELEKILEQFARKDQEEDTAAQKSTHAEAAPSAAPAAAPVESAQSEASPSAAPADSAAASSPAPATASPAANGATTASPEANATQAERDELERLKRQLAVRDEEIQALEEHARANTLKLNPNLPEDFDHPQNATVEEVIALYKAKILKRDMQIAAIKAQVAEQDVNLAIVTGEAPKTLDEIEEMVRQISESVNEARYRRDKLESEGKLDPELALMLEKLFEQEQALRLKVQKLKDMRAEAQRQRQLAKQRREEASRRLEEARAKMRSKGKDAQKRLGDISDDAADDAAMAASAAEKEAAEVEAAADKADKALLDAAKEVEQDLRGVSQGAKRLDTGVHPHGEKWWRYRYEHSFVEAFLIIVILIVMIFWERVYFALRDWLYTSAKGHSIDHLTAYIHWLEHLAAELCCCLVTFMTVWTMAQMGVFSVLNRFVQDHHYEHLHLPTTALEYRRLAFDMCVILFFAIIFYFALTLSVVHATMLKLRDWASFEVEAKAGNHGQGAESRFRIMANVSQFLAVRSYFIASIKADEHMKNHFGPAKMASLDENTFPFWLYMRLNVRQTIDHMYIFGLTVWFTILVTFGALLYLHFVWHLGYVRIMGFFAIQLVIIFVGMVYWIVSVNGNTKKQISDVYDASGSLSQRARMVGITDVNTEGIVIFMLHYVLFFLCYGASRMICQPWMWELHFWPVLCLTIFTVISTLVFCFLIAPLIPTFAAAQALPPYVDESNMILILEVMESEMKDTPEEFLLNHPA